MKTYKEIFKNSSEKKLISAVRNGMNVYLRIYEDKYGRDYETFFEAAIKYGTPALVNACIDMGAGVDYTIPEQELIALYHTHINISTLYTALRASNAGTLRALLERGARIWDLNDHVLYWDVQRNLIPEAEYDEEAKKIKDRLDTGAEILEILRAAGFHVPGSDMCDDKMSLYRVYIRGGCVGLLDRPEEYDMEERQAYSDWFDKSGQFADGADADEGRRDLYSECIEAELFEYAFPMPGTRPGALWHAASPEALKLMIKEGADVNARDAAGWTAIHHFAFNYDTEYYFNRGDMLQILLENGADINARGGEYGLTPLMLLIVINYEEQKTLDIAKLFLRNGAELYAADGKGDNFEYWADLFGRGKIFGEDILKEILVEMDNFARREKANNEDKTEGAYPYPTEANLDLMTAALLGTVKDLESILVRGANINARSANGYTPLLFASKCYNSPAVEFLTERGANVSAKIPSRMAFCLN